MNRTIGIAATGMTTRQTALEVAANNLANLGGVAFKGDRYFYRTLQAYRATPGSPTPSPAVQIPGTQIDFTQGNLRQTGNDLHLALEGKGFFVVLGSQGERLTRDGSFSLDSSGRIVNSSGLPLLGRRGPIQLREGTVSVDPTGIVTQNGVVVDRLRLVSDQGVSEKEGGTLYLPDGTTLAGSLPEAPEGSVQVHQGWLEEANVTAMQEMIHLMEAMRAFETYQRVIKSVDESVERIISNRLGRLTT